MTRLDLPPTAAAARPRWRIVAASVAGTTVEYADFFVYGTAAVLVFPALFFPSSEPTSALLSSLAVFGAAFVARPIGGAMFGSLGDRIGRRRTLVATLLTMGVATVGIGLLPTATQPGWEIAAPVLLVVLRFCQGLGLGGEWSGAALLATENAPSGRLYSFSALPQLGATLGFGFATACFLVLSLVIPEDEFLAWGWRVPFLLSAGLILFGLWVRRTLDETPAFRALRERDAVERSPLRTVLRRAPGAILIGIALPIADFALFYLLTTFSLVYATASTTATPPGLGADRSTVLGILAVGVLVLGIFTLVSAPLLGRLGARRYLAIVSGAVAVFGLTIAPLTDSGGAAGALVALVVGFALAGLCIAPLPAVVTGLFPDGLRYAGSAIAYNVSGILGAALTPFIAVALWQADGDLFLVGVYLAALAAVAVVAALAAPSLRRGAPGRHRA